MSSHSPVEKLIASIEELEDTIREDNSREAIAGDVGRAAAALSHAQAQLDRFTFEEVRQILQQTRDAQQERAYKRVMRERILPNCGDLVERLKEQTAD